MDNIILTALNFSKVCRVCLMECDSMFSIYSELFEDNSNEKIPCIFEILISISSIKVQSNDGLPSMICTKCIDKAHSSYKFQQQCNRSQALLEGYIEQIKELVKVEDVSTSAASENSLDFSEKYHLKSEITDNSNDTNENIMLPSQFVLINDVNLVNSKKGNEGENPNNEDCDDLKNCIPLGEDTVDQLIKDNLQVDNLELISPKIRSFSLELKTNENSSVTATGKSCKEPPNMNYYRKEKESGTVQYECNLCARVFKYANSLRIHLKNHDEEKPYVCSECKKGFKVYGSLMHHIRSHSGEQPYQCKECGKRYKQSGTLTAHMRIHTGSKPFLCSICGRGFRQAPDLTYHMRTHTKEKPYMCNVCGKTMSMQCHLVQHMRSHTGEKPFKCPECDKAFPSSTRLKRHSIIHTTLKPYKCHICDKSFNRSSSLRVHTKTHLGVRSHQCTVCNKAFLWAHSLRGHILTHSKEANDKKIEPTVPCATATTTPNSTTCSVTVVTTTTTSTTAAPTTSTPQAEKLNKTNTMTIYAGEKETDSKCFTIYSSRDSSDLSHVSETFQIYSIEAAEDQNGVETFTLYSAETNAEHTSTISSSAIQLSAVTL